MADSAEPGFAWRVQSQLGALPLVGSDHYWRGKGRMRMLLLGVVPVVDQSTPDLARSAIGRLVGEYMWLPSGWLPQAGATIEPVDADRFAVSVRVAGENSRLLLSVDAQGRLVDLRFYRCGDRTPDKHFQYIPFGGPYDPADGRTFGGYAIPTRIRAGWWYGTPEYEETFHIDFTDASYT